MPAFIIIFLLGIWFFDVWPFYSGHFRPIAREYNYEVFFYHPGNRKESLGDVSNIGSCRYRADKLAKQKQYAKDTWTYRCCRIVRGNRCAKTEM